MRRKFDEKTPELIKWRNHIVMSESERPFFEKLFERIADLNVSCVLEVGFGLGISAKLIQDTFHPKCHEIVEIDATIFEDLQAFCSVNRTVNAIRGDFWKFKPQRQYDFIFYDPFEYKDIYLDQWAHRHMELLIPGGIVCAPIFDLDAPPETTIAGFKRLRRDVFRVPPYLLWDGRRVETGIFECWQRNSTAFRRSNRNQNALAS